MQPLQIGFHLFFFNDLALAFHLFLFVIKDALVHFIKT
jgi:hypothetical protein